MRITQTQLSMFTSQESRNFLQCLRISYFGKLINNSRQLACSEVSTRLCTAMVYGHELSEMVGAAVVLWITGTLHYQSRDPKINPPLLQSFRYHFKLSEVLSPNDLVVSGTHSLVLGGSSKAEGVS